MSLTVDDMKCVMNKKFTKFSDAVKKELGSKLVSHETIANYTSEMERMNSLKRQFSEITKSSEGE